MNDILDQALLIVPILLVIFARLAIEKYRKNRQDAAKTLSAGASAAPRATRGTSLFASLFGGAQQIQASLSPENMPAARAAVPPPKPLSPTAYDAPTVSVAVGEAVPAEAAVAVDGIPGVAKVTRPSVLIRLPPLKRALVMSEILGKPKSLSGPASWR